MAGLTHVDTTAGHRPLLQAPITMNQQAFVFDANGARPCLEVPFGSVKRNHHGVLAFIATQSVSFCGADAVKNTHPSLHITPWEGA